MQVNTCSIRLTGSAGPVAPAMLLGVNVEMTDAVHAAMMADRLDNPKFCGPADGQTGLAPGWKPYGNNMGGVHCKLVSGMFMSGTESQMVHVYTGEYGGGILQTGVYVRAGEELELEIWAKVRHHPVTIDVSLRPLPSRAPEYDKAVLTIDAAYWKRYTAHLRTTVEDREAVLQLLFATPGVVLFDQIHLRPVENSPVCRETAAAIGGLLLPTLRYPGGCMSTNYHWRLGTGEAHMRPSLPDPVFKQRTDYDFGTDEYLAMCLEQGIKPFLVVNIGSGTPDEAGEWAAYCAKWYRQRGIEPPEIYVQMGNEQYGAWETSHMNAAMYAEAVRAFVPAIKASYSNVRIIVLGEPLCSGVAGEPDTLLRERVLGELREMFDVIAINRYKGQWRDTAEEQIVNAVESVHKIEDDLQALIADCRKHGSDAKVALTEWNYWLHASHWDGKGFAEPDDALHGLFFAGMVHALARLAPDVELAVYYHLINVMGLVRNDRGRVSKTAMGELYRLYRPAFPGEVLPLAVDSPELAPGAAQLDALAVRTDEGCWLYVSNRSLAEAAAVELPAMPGRLRSARLMTAEHELAPLREAEAAGMVRAHAVAGETKETSMASGAIIVSASGAVSVTYSAEGFLMLPPLSIARLGYEGEIPIGMLAGTSV